MNINCMPVFDRLNADFLHLPTVAEDFNCIAAERMHRITADALVQILAIQREELRRISQDLDDESAAPFLREIKRIEEISLRLEALGGVLHDFFLQPHLYERMNELTIVSKSTLLEFRHLLHEVKGRTEELSRVTNQLESVYDEGTRENYDIRQYPR